MQMLILWGSPRQQGNTETLAGPFIEEWKKAGHTCRGERLYDCSIKPCLACRSCQRDWNRVYCIQKDDVPRLAREILESDLLVLASPVYSWYCTPPLKALLDRLVYMMNKYYGEKGIGPSLWAGKGLVLLTTCGYPPEKGADLWEEGMKRYCRHSRLRFLGALTERQRTYGEPFMDPEKAAHARNLAKKVMAALGDH
jgi:putative NADPH-quinone reductase